MGLRSRLGKLGLDACQHLVDEIDLLPIGDDIDVLGTLGSLLAALAVLEALLDGRSLLASRLTLVILARIGEVGRPRLTNIHATLAVVEELDELGVVHALRAALGVDVLDLIWRQCHVSLSFRHPVFVGNVWLCHYHIWRGFRLLRGICGFHLAPSPCHLCSLLGSWITPLSLLAELSGVRGSVKLPRC